MNKDKEALKLKLQLKALQGKDNWEGSIVYKFLSPIVTFFTALFASIVLEFKSEIIFAITLALLIITFNFIANRVGYKIWSKRNE